MNILMRECVGPLGPGAARGVLKKVSGHACKSLPAARPGQAGEAARLRLQGLAMAV